ncbi:MAG: c-type cytochrome [Candidatus Binatia bacterium]
MRRSTFALGLLLASGAVSAVAGADGKSLYESKCTMCHEKDGAPKKMGEGSASFNDPKWQAANSVDAIAKVIAEGKGKMKPYKDKLSEEEIKAVADYLKTLK